MDKYDKCLQIIDRVLRESGRSNILYKDDLIKIRNQIVDLQEEEVKKKCQKQ